MAYSKMTEDQLTDDVLDANNEDDYEELEEEGPKKHLTGQLLDYLMNLARKNINGEDSWQLQQFDPEVSQSFLNYVKDHPEKSKFPSDEVYYYICALYNDEIEDVLGVDFLVAENDLGLNERLIEIYEKEKKEYYQANQDKTPYKKSSELIANKRRKLEEDWDSKMREQIVIPSLDLSDLID